MTVAKVATKATPLIAEAFRILFKEGREILKERRERREKEGEGVSTREESQSVTASGAVLSMDDSRLEYVKEELFMMHEKEIEHLIGLFKMHKKNLRSTENMLAMYSSLNQPLNLINQRDDLEEKIVEVMEDLQRVLSQVQGEEIRIPELLT